MVTPVCGETLIILTKDPYLVVIFNTRYLAEMLTLLIHDPAPALNYPGFRESKTNGFPGVSHHGIPRNKSWSRNKQNDKKQPYKLNIIF